MFDNTSLDPIHALIHEAYTSLPTINPPQMLERTSDFSRRAQRLMDLIPNVLAKSLWMHPTTLVHLSNQATAAGRS